MMKVERDTLQWFANPTGYARPVPKRYLPATNRLVRDGLLETDGPYTVITEAGRARLSDSEAPEHTGDDDA